MDLKKQKAEEEFVREQEDAYKTKIMLNNEQEDFIQYAEEWIKDYYKQGKDITPLLLELKSYKKNTTFA